MTACLHLANVGYFKTDYANMFLLGRILSHTHTRTFNGPFSGTTQVSQYQKGKTQSGFY